MIIPGQYVPVRLIIGERDALLIPQTAVVEVQGSSQVYTVDNDNKAKARSVTLGIEQGDMIVVENGLKAGDKVISEGTSKVRPGMPVKPMTGGAKAKSDPKAKPAG